MSERAAELIRSARERAGLSQRELAARAGVAAARISEYETGKKDPTFAMIDRIVAAAGALIGLVSESAVAGRPERLRRLAAAAVDRSMRIEGKQVRGERSVADLRPETLLGRIASHRP